LRPDVRPVGEGVQEARIDYGPGYRVYFGFDGTGLIVLLLCGDKRTQEGRAVQRSSVTQRLAAAKPKVRAEGRFGTSPFAYFAVQSSLLRRPYLAVTPGPTAGKPPRQSARFSTANNANNANGPATAQAPGEAFDLWTRVAGSGSLSLRSVNRER
jgi:hypothetical protein